MLTSENVMFIRRNMFAMVLVLVNAPSYAVTYGAPYYNDSHYPYGGLQASTVDGAIQLWWAAYKEYWNVNSCSYSLTHHSDGPVTGKFVYKKLEDGCTGGGWILGTPDGIDVPKNQGNRCKSKNLHGNPINIAVGNKYQKEVDFRSVGAFPLTVSRSYNSNANSWGFMSAVQEISAGEIIGLLRADGQLLTFRYESDQWSSDPDVMGTLSATEDTLGDITSWTYTSGNDQIETYDAQGRILNITDRSGLSHTYSYQSDSITVTHTSGEAIVYQLDTEGRVIGFTDPDNNAYQYSYDTEERLVTVTYPDDTPSDSTDNPKRIYHYEDVNFPHALTGITDEKGSRYATWIYDDQKRAISSEHANGVDKTTISYNADGTTTVTNPLGKQTTYHFTTIHGVRKVTQVEGHPTTSCEGANKSYQYDANGNVISKTDWNGIETTYTYDMDRNLELSRTEAVGTPHERTITTEWHPRFRLTTKITEPNKITEYTYDGQGRQLTSKVSSNQ